VAEKDCLDVRRGRWAEDESGEGAEELPEVEESREGWGNVMYIPCIPIVQSRYESPSSKSVSREMLDKVSHSVSELWQEGWIYIPAFETLQLVRFDFLEPRVSESADECVLCQTLSERERVEASYASPQSGRSPRARRTNVPSDKQRTEKHMRSRLASHHDRRQTYYLSSWNLGGMGLLRVSEQNNASNAWKQCSGVQTDEFSRSSIPVGGGSGGRRDIGDGGHSSLTSSLQKAEMPRAMHRVRLSAVNGSVVIDTV
jgi:hypothetical protein